MNDKEYLELFEKYFVNDTEVDFIGEKDFATFMRFANNCSKRSNTIKVIK